MLRPRYIEKMPQRVVEIMSEIESDMLSTVARRILKFGEITGSTEYTIKKAQQMGILHQELLEIISKKSGITEEYLQTIFEKAGFDSMSYDNAIYERAKKEGLTSNEPLSPTDPALQSILNAGISNAKSAFNLTNTKCIQSATSTYTNALDKAYLSIITGAEDYHTAFRRAIDDIAKSKIEVIEYTKDGKTIHYGAEAAARRSIITSVNQTTLKMQEENLNRMGCNLVETSSHAGARPSHAEWQGKVFYYNTPVEGYESFIAVCRYGQVDGIGGANCRHSWYPFYEGLSEPSFDRDPSKELGIDNDEHYELTQEQRKLERRIREAKKELAVYEAAGDEDKVKEARAKIAQRQSDLRDFIEENDKYLSRDYSRESIGTSRGTKSESKPQAKDVTKIDNFKELSSYLSDSYNIKLDSKVESLNLQAIKKPLEGVEWMIKQHPEIGNAVESISTKKVGVMASNGRRIYFNDSTFMDPETLTKNCEKMAESGWWVKNSNPQSIGVHESAHVLEWVLCKSNPAYIGELQRMTAFKDCVEAKSIVSQACINIKKTSYGKGKLNNELKSSISRYALYSASETMAEAFADYYVNGSNANPLSIEIRKLTISQLKKYKE